MMGFGTWPRFYGKFGPSGIQTQTAMSSMSAGVVQGTRIY